MAIHATVVLFKNQFVAELSDGRILELPDFQKMAEALHCAGVLADDVRFDWKAGQRMITAGQQVALCAEMRRLARERRAHVLSIAA